MAFGNQILTSIFGRRLGLQRLTSANSGSANGDQEFLVGPADFRVGVTTNDTTSGVIKSHGVSLLPASSVGSSQVFTLDPPIPGVWKTIVGSTAATAFVKTGGPVILSTVGSTQTVIGLPAAGGSISLVGVTTALWATNNTTASGVNLTNST